MRKKLTQEYVKNYCLERGYRVMSPYINAKTKIKLQNIKTEAIGRQKFNNFQQGQRFDNPKATKKLTQEEVSRYCESQGYYLKSQYINENAKIRLQNIKTGVIGYTSFDNFKRGKRFDSPNAKVKLTYQEYIQSFANEGYVALINEKEYKNINSHTKIEVLCPSGHKWSVNKNNFTRHRRCPMCNQSGLGGMSYGERIIYSILSGNNINFKREVSVEINGENHRFDFYLELNNKKYFIEYDGEQHFKERVWFSGKIEERQKRDRVKDKYAKDNGIIMVRIPYTENTVGKVVKMINYKTDLDLHKVKLDMPKKQEVLDYYLNHSQEETANRFGISMVTVCNYAQDIWGMSKREYLIKTGKKSEIQKEIADYYLNHNIEETEDKFGINRMTIHRYFKKEYGIVKREYLKTLDK